VAKLPTYSSLTAFLAHYHALASADRLDAAEREMLKEMTEYLGHLTPDDLTALRSNCSDAAARRRRARAELKLSRLLLSGGVIAG